MRRLILMLLLAAWSPGALAASTLLRCTALDAAALNRTGMIERSPQSVGARMQWEAFTVDLISGLIRRNGVTLQGYVTQTGGTGNDTIVVVYANPVDHPRAASTDFLRVRQWTGMPQPVFLAYSLTSIVTGTCEAL